MRIVVTGGSGKLGRAVVADLAEHGHDVVNIDRVAPRAGAPGSFVRVDLGDHGQVVEALSGIDDRYARVDALVHLAAVPAPGLTGNVATFVNNVVGSHHVFSAARLAGIRNIVWASSETLLGLPFGPDTPPPYIPVDEEYAVRPQSTYSLTKALDEEAARHLCRWDPQLKMVGLRFSNVMEPEEYAAFPGFEDAPEERIWNLWAYIDARDGAQAVRRALQWEATGSHVFVIANADSVMSTDSATLAATHFPGVEVRGDLAGTVTMLSIDKARRALGFEPQHSWRDPDARAATPSVE
jgi:nucleoside-diphosphate-sugar epimerase